MLEPIIQLIDNLNLNVVEKIDVAGRPERRMPLPKLISQGLLSDLVASIFGPEKTAWTHQSLGLQTLCDGKNIVIATGTASGKSLIFQLYAFQRVLEDDTARVVVFYPLKALASDQFVRWQELANAIGLPSGAVARIDGDVPTSEREEMLSRSRIILMTPDVCHAWFMRTVGSGLTQRFLENLALLILDEAHVYESVFGSNLAFLLRRMISAKRQSTRPHHGTPELQMIAATATIANPAEHLHRLTGLEFDVIGEEQNGAPQFERQIIHVNGADYGAAGEAALVDIGTGIIGLDQRHRFITFCDSRQGVERIVRQIGTDGVLPYRSGYEAHDRHRIEHALRTGGLHGVVSTSALELGIDIADMEIGVNLGVPQSRKAFRQRIGRIGRASPGAFLLVASPNAFRRLGETFSEYLQSSVEPSYLYLGNRFIQFAHARCLMDELEVLGAERNSPPAGVKWPDGFAEVLGYAKPGGGRPREFDFIAHLGADAPHFNYPLRQVGEVSFDIREGTRNHSQRIGTIAANQAIREAFPGANYLHLGGAYKVYEWSTRRFDRSIRVSETRSSALTRPLLRKTATISLERDGIVDGRILTNETGLVAEVHVQVNESVEGYKIGSTSYLYRDLRKENPNMRRQQRDFRTTGVVVKIEESWFSGSGNNAQVREQVAAGLMSAISRNLSIAPQDIDATHTNIAVLTESGPKRLTDTIVVYDGVYGGLRLTEKLFDNFRDYISQLDRAATLAGEDAFVQDNITDKLITWSDSLMSAEEAGALSVAVPEGWYQVYRPGSIVSIYRNNVLYDREIIEPKIVDVLGQQSLFYAYKQDSGVAFVPHDQVQATGHEWGWILWNPETGEYQELEALDDLPSKVARGDKDALGAVEHDSP